MKNILRKVSVLGTTALVALGMSLPAVSAVAPSGSDVGIHYDEVSIGQGTLSWGPTLTLASGLVFNGSAQQLITAVTNEIPNGATLYLRVSDVEGGPSSSEDWVAYSNAESLTNALLKRANAGTYHIYWYLDGGSNNQDITHA